LDRRHRTTNLERGRRKGRSKLGRTQQAEGPISIHLDASDIREITHRRLLGKSEDVELRLEFVDTDLWEGKRIEFLINTNTQVELKNTMILLVKNDDAVEELFPEIVRSEKVLGDVDEVTQPFIDLCRKRYDTVLMNPPLGFVLQRVLDYLQDTYVEKNTI
jgi:hypothetical protein